MVLRRYQHLKLTLVGGLLALVGAGLLVMTLSAYGMASARRGTD